MKKLKLILLSLVSMLLLASAAYSEPSPLYIKAKKGAHTGNQVNVELELWNNTAGETSMHDVTIRYYFNSKLGHPYFGEVWYFDHGPQPRIRCTSQYSDQNANQFCDIVFHGYTSKLAGYSAVSLEVIFYGSPRQWENMDDDFSNPANSSSFTTNSKISVYKGGRLIWGEWAKNTASPITVESYEGLPNDKYTMEPIMRITNRTSMPIETKNLKVRYYNSGYKQYLPIADVWYDDAPGGTPQASCYHMPVEILNGYANANRYCEVTFPYGGTLHPYAGFDLDVAFMTPSAAQAQESNWSWNGTTNRINKRIAVFDGNILIWGDIPK